MSRIAGSAASTAALVVAAAFAGGLAAPPATADVPPPTATTSVINVRVGGDREPLDITPLAGVELGLYVNATDTTPVAGFGTCVSDADGDCSFVVPDTQVGGANRDRRFWVKQIAVPTGWYTVEPLAVGPPTVTPYRFRTGSELRAGSTYESGIDFMTVFDEREERLQSSGIWAVARDNPPSPEPRCDLRFAFVLDLSGDAGASAPDVAASAQAVVDAIRTQGSRISATASIYTFATTAPATGPFNGTTLDVPITANQGQIDTVISRLSASPGLSSWGAGIAQVVPEAATYDVVAVITGLGPTGRASPAQADGTIRFADLELGVFAANGIKAEGTPVLAWNIGERNEQARNVRAISGQTEGVDYFVGEASPRISLPQTIAELATTRCEKSVTVRKLVVPDGGTIEQATPEGGYQFDATATGSVTTIPSTRTDRNGLGTFPVRFEIGSAGTLTLTEEQRPGYTLVPVGGSNATCVRTDTGDAVPASDAGALGFTIPVSDPAPVTCTVYNQAPPPSTITVTKSWVVNGIAYPEGAQPLGLTGTATVDGGPLPFGTVLPDVEPGILAAIGEVVDVSGAPLCSLTGQRLTTVNGRAVDLALPSNQVVQLGANTYGITNTVACTSSLGLGKQVANGPASPASWTLTATGPPGALPGPTGTTGATATVTPGVAYVLAESGGDPRYVQDDEAADPAPGSTGSWTCTAPDGRGIVGVDGVDGSVTVPVGQAVVCTAVNRTALLSLSKTVVNERGGTAEPDDWTLTATPVDPPPGVVPVSVLGGDGSASPVRPGTAYRLDESGPSGYATQGWACTDADGAGVPLTGGDTFTPTAGAAITCAVTNADQPGSLTLRKDVDAAASGSGRVPADWTLTATRVADPDQPVVSGDGEDGVTAVEVDAGDYVLSEAGPPGFEPGDWTCTGGELSGGVVTVANGADVTCTITNAAIAPTLTLVMTVDNGGTGGTAVAGDWTLTADNGVSTVTGRSGSPDVTGVATTVGEYELAEAGPGGYSRSGWSCTGASASTATTVTLAEGDAATCTITSTAVAPRLTLALERVGAGAAASAWTVTASSNPTISGPVGSPAVTDAVVPVGVWALSVSGGPSGYTLSSWRCSGASSSTGSSVTLALGDVVTCTVTITAAAAPPAGGRSAPLPDTGAAVVPPITTAILLVLGGALLLGVGRLGRRPRV